MKRWGLAIVGISMLSWVFASVEAIAEERWTLQRCIEYALEHNPDIQAAKARVDASAEDVDAQRRSFRPRLDLEATAGYYEGNPLTPFAVVRGVTEEGIRSRHVSSGYLFAAPVIRIPILQEGAWFGLNSPTVQVASQQLSVDRSTLEAEKNEIVLNVSTAFWNVLKNLQDIRAAEEHMKFLRLDYEIASSKFKEHLVSKNDLLMAEVRLATGQKDLAVYQNLATTLMAELRFQLGLEPTIPITLAEESWTPPQLASLEDLLQQALANRPEIKAQQARVALAEQERRRGAAQRYPVLSVSSSYGIASDAESESNRLWSTALECTVPLFDFGATSSQIRTLAARVAEAEKTLQSIKNSIAREVLTAYTGIQNQATEIALQEKLLEQSTENAQVVRGRFQQNLLPLSALLEAEYSVYDNQKRLVQARCDLWTRHLELARAVGALPFKR